MKVESSGGVEKNYVELRGVRNGLTTRRHEHFDDLGYYVKMYEIFVEYATLELATNQVLIENARNDNEKKKEEEEFRRLLIEYISG